MDLNAEDEEIVRLLTKLKNTEGEYPSRLLAARREQYLHRIAEIEFGIVANNGAKPAVESNPAPNPAATASTLLETILIIAIIAEASAVTYFYRDKVTDFLQNVTSAPRVEEVTQPPVVTLPPALESLTPSPVMTSTALSPTVSESPAPTSVVTNRTPVPGFAGDDPLLNTQVDSTPALNGSDGNNGDNGNHYGQTPKPERTKENNGNNDTQNDTNPPPRNNNNSPPRENRDEPKPTKSK